MNWQFPGLLSDMTEAFSTGNAGETVPQFPRISTEDTWYDLFFPPGKHNIPDDATFPCIERMEVENGFLNIRVRDEFLPRLMLEILVETEKTEHCKPEEVYPLIPRSEREIFEYILRNSGVQTFKLADPLQESLAQMFLVHHIYFDSDHEQTVQVVWFLSLMMKLGKIKSAMPVVRTDSGSRFEISDADRLRTRALVHLFLIKLRGRPFFRKEAVKTGSIMGRIFGDQKLVPGAVSGQAGFQNVLLCCFYNIIQTAMCESFQEMVRRNEESDGKSPHVE